MRKKIIRYSVLICILCFVMLGIVSYSRVSAMMLEQIKSDAMDIVMIAANEISGEELEAVSSRGDKEYRYIYDTLDKYKKGRMITYIYTMKMLDDKLVFVVDADYDAADVFEEYEWLDSMAPAFNGEVCCDKTVTSDRWGSYFSAYAPVFFSDGRVAGIVGCDIMVTDIDVKLNKLRNLIVLIVSLFGLSILAVYIIMSQKMVNCDVLTEVPNYNRLLMYGEKLGNRGRLSQYTGLLVNIKDFKYLNQQIGVNFGDEILREYAGHIKHIVGKNGFVSRTGNDNFFILIRKGQEDKIINAIAGMEISVAPGGRTQKFRIMSRCGLYRICDGDSINNAMNCCTLALNEARNLTYSDIVWYEDKLADIMLTEKKTLTDFRNAIDNHEFVVYYQPKVDIKTNMLCGAEALVRWVKDGNIVPPMQFIPILEKEGSVVELDYYVFKQVCKDISGWINQGIEPVRISTNFSRLHLIDEDFSKKIMDIVAEVGVDTRYLEVELTELSAYSDFDALASFLGSMKNNNIFTSIDDFGTGYSSLSTLLDLDVDVVKIDKSFFNKSEQPINKKMLENVIHMINDMDRIVICEGVETQNQAEFLKNTDCSIVQGYLYDKPLTHDDFEERLKNPQYS